MSGIFSAGGAGNVGVSGFYPVTINDSLRFEDGSSAYLNRTPSSAGNRQTWTWSGWVKRANLSAVEQDLFSAGNSSTDRFEIILSAAYPDQLEIYMNTGGAIGDIVTSQVFRDVSAFYHLVVAFDTTQATASNRVKIYVNGSQVTDFQTATYPSQNFNTAVNSTSGQFFSRRNYVADRYYDGYMADVYMIDGQALDPTSFGEAKDGTWIPKSYSGSYGTNGFHLEFNGNTNDTSGNSNNWTANNISAHDYVPDSPTNNFATLNPLYSSTSPSYPTPVLSEGNLAASTNSGSNWKTVPTTMYMSTGKWYSEVRVTYTDYVDSYIGFVSSELNGQNYAASETAFGYQFHPTLGIRHNSTQLSAQTFTQGDIIGLALNMDDNEIKFYKNGSLLYTATSVAAGSWSVALTLLYTKTLYANFGQDSTFAGGTTAGGNTDANGVGDFKYAPPSGYLALCTSNLPEPTIIDGSEYFNTVLYTGNGGTQSITGVGFGSAPDLVWVKNRDKSDRFHLLTDTVRGATKSLSSNLTSNEASTTYSNGLTSFNSDGFSVGNLIDFNGTNDRIVSWNWKAGTSFSNSAGTNGATIATSGSVNTDAGFSIFETTSNPTDTLQSYGHGLNQAPELVFIKTLDSSQGWLTYHKDNGFDKYMFLNSTIGDTSLTDAFANVTDTVVQTRYFASQSDIVGYCWHSVDGYSKVGSYIGGGSNFPFIYTGFRPSFILIKSSTYSSTNWLLFDNKRGVENPVELELNANNANQEYDNARDIDFVSNGFKIRSGANNNLNTSGGTYIYLAFGQPFKYANAR